ncbi:MAG: argininosuccinate lyase [Bacillota bacterium]
MEKMWSGRFKKSLAKETNDFNSSISFDAQMFEEDITGSIAHATMLADCNIISCDDAEKIKETLAVILAQLKDGTLEFDSTAEDIHMFIEAELTSRIGDAGKRLHTSRSRNDQVALDLRMHLKNQTVEISQMLSSLLETLCDLADKTTETVMPGYTHLQRAQPVTFAHVMMAYSQMFMRDKERLFDCHKRMNVCPLGSCALAGTTYPIDRNQTSSLLGFDRPSQNSLDGVSDRDFVIELGSAISMIMMHLSRFSEEVIMWCSWEFKFVELDDAYSTGSSIMPQKKNPDIPELIRGKTGRVYGNLMGILTVMKGLPLAYNKDMQEDKEGIFDSVKTVKNCLPIFDQMMQTIRLREDNMLSAVQKGFVNATDCADYLVKKGMPFRSAYKITGELVAECIDTNHTMNTLPLDVYKAKSELFEDDIYIAVDIMECVKKRTSMGSPSPQCVREQIAYTREFLSAFKF